MYQPYPTSGGQPPEPVRPEAPTPVQNAVKLMYAGAALSAISLIITLVTIGSLRTAIHNADPTLTPAKVHSAEVAAVAVAVIFGLIGIGLWIWMAYANKAGKNWARITATVFFALDTLSVLASLRQAEPVLTRVVSILIWLTGLGAIILLWRRESSDVLRRLEDTEVARAASTAWVLRRPAPAPGRRRRRPGRAWWAALRSAASRPARPRRPGSHAPPPRCPAR